MGTTMGLLDGLPDSMKKEALSKMKSETIKQSKQATDQMFLTRGLSSWFAVFLAHPFQSFWNSFSSSSLLIYHIDLCWSSVCFFLPWRTYVEFAVLSLFFKASVVTLLCFISMSRLLISCTVKANQISEEFWFVGINFCLIRLISFLYPYRFYWFFINCLSSTFFLWNFFLATGWVKPSLPLPRLICLYSRFAINEDWSLDYVFWKILECSSFKKKLFACLFLFMMYTFTVSVVL